MFRHLNEEKNFDIKKGILLLSNSVEVLLEHLKENLFSESGKEDVFAERLVIVPSSGIQQWIQMQMANSLSISCGYTSTFLNKGIDILREKLFCSQKKWLVPSQIELFLLIEQEITRSLTSDDPIWDPLVQYVGEKEKRKFALTKLLVRLFIRYGVYGNKCLRDWEANPRQWQEALWANIFKHWDTPQKILLSLEEKREKPPKMSVHLFAFSHLSPLHFHFFCRVAHVLPVYFYHLSPCQEFWSELPENAPLLSSLGRVGREMAKLIEDAPLATEEAYLVFGGNTQLKKLQRELLTLETSPQVFDDDSLQLHSSSTPYREIENLYDTLSRLLVYSGWEPKDIIVMAPQITQYAPYIEAIFAKERSGIDFQITDMPLQKKDPVIEGLFLLFNLEKKRWTTTALFELFSHNAFRKKQGFNEEEIIQIKKWAEETGIRWGVHGKHRAALLKKGNCQRAKETSSATWLEGLGYLVEELALPSPHKFSRIDFTQAELLGQTITLINSLYSDIEALQEERSLKEWGENFQQLLKKYFYFSEESVHFLSFLSHLERAERQFPNKPYSFSLVFALLSEFLTEESATINRNACQAIRFCSLQPMRAIPARVICFLGMNHDSFPRKEESLNLDLLKEQPSADYAPSRIDFDRHLFLEAILSARDKIIISYIGQDPYDLSELPPSSVVTEILPFISEKQRFKHALHKLDHVQIEPPATFSIKINKKFTLPKGEFFLTPSDLTRAARSGLSHYFNAQEVKIIEEKTLEEEEDFIMSPLHSATLRSYALKYGPEKALQLAKREGKLPPEIFGEVAKEHLRKNLEAIPSVFDIEIPSISLDVTPDLTVVLSGQLSGIYAEGLCLTNTSEIKNAVKAWPSFLLLNTVDATKNKLFFAASQEEKIFMLDPLPQLNNFLQYYFYAKENPFPLIPEWVEPILKRDIKKLKQAPIFDTLLLWQLQGKNTLDYIQIMEECGSFVDKIYREMADAWF